jgi:hypothetical protein
VEGKQKEKRGGREERRAREKGRRLKGREA